VVDRSYPDAALTTGKVLFSGPKYDFPITGQEFLRRRLGRSHERGLAAADFIVPNLNKRDRATTMLVAAGKQFICNTLCYSSLKLRPLAKGCWRPRNSRFEAEIIRWSALKADICVARWLAKTPAKLSLDGYGRFKTIEIARTLIVPKSLEAVPVEASVHGLLVYVSTARLLKLGGPLVSEMASGECKAYSSCMPPMKSESLATW
jgi:hypothetical protein